MSIVGEGEEAGVGLQSRFESMSKYLQTFHYSEFISKFGHFLRLGNQWLLVESSPVQVRPKNFGIRKLGIHLGSMDFFLAWKFIHKLCPFTDMTRSHNVKKCSLKSCKLLWRNQCSWKANSPWLEAGSATGNHFTRHCWGFPLIKSFNNFTLLYFTRLWLGFSYSRNHFTRHCSSFYYIMFQQFSFQFTISISIFQIVFFK